MSRRMMALLACPLAGLLLLRTAPAPGQQSATAQPRQKGAVAKAKAARQEPVKTKPDVIFVPTPQEVVDAMLELAEVKQGDVVYDLGCGDGRIVVTAAEKYGAKGVGIDIDPERIKESRENVRRHNVGERVTIKQGDLFREDFREATVVTLYLLPSLNEKLIPQLEKLKPGTRIVSHDFTMKGVKPAKSTRVNGHEVYLWILPLDKEP
ncbi:MAG: methyltransferase domain-containing protein [Isosphaeraceae bacterium]